MTSDDLRVEALEVFNTEQEEDREDNFKNECSTILKEMQNNLNNIGALQEENQRLAEHLQNLKVKPFEPMVLEIK